MSNLSLLDQMSRSHLFFIQTHQTMLFCQNDEDGHEERFSTIEKEYLTIKLGIEALRVYLLGKPFTIQTDHCSLMWLD